MGLAVPKRLVAKAVDRNRIKRMARELVRLKTSHASHQDRVLKLKAAVGKKTGGRLRLKEKNQLQIWLAGIL
jgi:ribonuclease P protein component